MNRNPIYKQFTCSKCGASWNAARASRNSNGEVLCVSCKRLENPDYLKNKTFSDKECVCSVCGKEFTSKKVLRNYIGDLLNYKSITSTKKFIRNPE